MINIELIVIDEEFKTKLKSVISEGAKLSLLRESRKPHRKFAIYNSYSLKKFNSILNYLISQPTEITDSQRSLIRKLKLISGSTEKDVTKTGFRFLLSEKPAQVNQLIIQYLEYAKNERLNVAALLKLLFNLHLTLYEKLYVFKSDENNYLTYSGFLNDLEELGLIHQRKRKGKEADKPKKIMKSSLLHLWQEEIPPKEIQEADKFLVVESNFRYAAYTSAPYHKFILSLFSQINYQFPNCIIGKIDSEKVIRALKKGITAEQICFYLKKHGRYQIEAENIDPKLSVIPENVLMQIRLWEEDLHCLKCQEGLLVTGFDTTEKCKKFIRNAKNEGILVYANELEKVVVCKGSSTRIMEMYSKI